MESVWNAPSCFVLLASTRSWSSATARSAGLSFTSCASAPVNPPVSNRSLINLSVADPKGSKLLGSFFVLQLRHETTYRDYNQSIDEYAWLSHDHAYAVLCQRVDPGGRCTRSDSIPDC